ncbi:probable plastid-lipid-associated protein 10, chloroplastic isoform X1 [Primulina eburnea]|uniref:probable plastid-lipid-associated protein 10, chloroplastic isoform X1 n=1 Tax=Primulina eburnea TaxID=1245227 RepID=UPI003C6C8BFB
MDGPLYPLVLPLSTTPFHPPLLLSCPRNLYLAFHLPRQTRLQSLLCLASSSIPSSIKDSAIELEDRKFELLRAVADTKRGLLATTEQRSSIEEALINVEMLDAGKPLDLRILDGTWRLQYTSAPDVLILLQSAATLPFLEVDQIFQNFECGDKSGHCIVRNVVKWSIPRLLEDQEGATLVVSAKFSVISSRNICLEFEEISIQNVNISEELQALIAPSILPRQFLSLQILQFIRSFKAQFPVRNLQRRSVGGLYYLSYLDSNMLLGRAVGGGGVFIFTRAQSLIDLI